MGKSFEDVVTQETPRLVVMVSNTPNGDEQFQWGVVGYIPILSVIGAVSNLQARINEGEWIDKCPQNAIVIAWVDNKFHYFAALEVLSEGCVGMLELIKNMLVDTHRARTIASQKIIIGTDGKPMKFGVK